MEQEQSFFNSKKPWSKYKDLILDYYLQPYLQKIKNLGKPILVVDCFAGQGRFDDGEPGSPLIILERLLKLHQDGYKVSGYFIEKEKPFYEKLEKNVAGSAVPSVTRMGDFRDFVPDIAEKAKDSSVFLYLDPLKPTQLLFEDMKLVYDNLHAGRSVETLINFMSWNFLRGVWGIQDMILSDNRVLPDHPLALKFDKVAGGTYWQNIAFGSVDLEDDLAEKLATGYSSVLHSTGFEYVLKYAIRNNYEDQAPKYHLVFGSRHPDALELMNRAMVKARREFVKDRFVKGYLFPNEPEKEVVNPIEIEKIVVDTAKKIGKTTWNVLRIKATIVNPCIYTDSELNKAIKEAIKKGKLKSSCSGAKIEEDATVWFA